LFRDPCLADRTGVSLETLRKLIAPACDKQRPKKRSRYLSLATQVVTVVTCLQGTKMLPRFI